MTWPRLMWMPEGTRLGHIGGDDVVIVSGGLIPQEVMEALCRAYEQRKL